MARPSPCVPRGFQPQKTPMQTYHDVLQVFARIGSAASTHQRINASAHLKDSLHWLEASSRVAAFAACHAQSQGKISCSTGSYQCSQ